jgi:DNA-binding transcriptional MerR regulator
MFMDAQSKNTVADSFSATRAAAFAGISRAMLNYLCREQIVVPSVLPSRGHGSPRAYSFGDVVALRLVAKLSAAGVSVLRLRKAMQRLRKLHPEITLTSLPGSHVVTDGRDLYIKGKGETLERAMDGQFAFAFVVELEPIRNEVADSILKSQKAGTGRARQVA